jgi:hypothetical protein
MEFSYKVTEAEFREGWRVERRASSRSSLKTAAFWISIMLGLLLLYRVMQPSHHQPGIANLHAEAQVSTAGPASQQTPASTLIERAGPFLVLAGLWIIIVTALVPMRLKYLYRKDPRMHAKFTVDITPNFIFTHNSAGTTSKTGWNVYDYWCEGKNVIVLAFLSGSHSIVSLAGLSELQRGELRGILSASLRKR